MEIVTPREGWCDVNRSLVRRSAIETHWSVDRVGRYNMLGVTPAAPRAATWLDGEDDAETAATLRRCHELRHALVLHMHTGVY